MLVILIIPPFQYIILFLINLFFYRLIFMPLLYMLPIIVTLLSVHYISLPNINFIKMNQTNFLFKFLLIFFCWVTSMVLISFGALLLPILVVLFLKNFILPILDIFLTINSPHFFIPVIVHSSPLTSFNGMVFSDLHGSNHYPILISHTSPTSSTSSTFSTSSQRQNIAQAD